MKHLVIAVIALLCAGCQSLQTTYDDSNRQPALTDEPYNYWLRIADLYLEFDPRQAQQHLDEMGNEKKTDLQWFRYGLLNQQLGEPAGWIRARDGFRHLLTVADLDADVKSLVKLLLKYNQSMINWDARYNKVTLQLRESETKQQELEKKIQAITNLEQNMSSRKEQGHELESDHTSETMQSQ